MASKPLASTPPSVWAAQQKESANDNKNVLEDKFRATRMWNLIVRRFKSDMPLKRHRRQLTYYDDSFTGKEAVDFLLTELPKVVMDGREITRDNCIKLLQKFLDQSLFKRPRVDAKDKKEKDTFRDNVTLYVFNDDVDLLARTPQLVRRANSFSGSASAERATRAADATPIRYRRLASPKVWQPFEIPTSPMKQHSSNLNRRLSSSHGNLMLTARMSSPPPPPPPTGLDSVFTSQCSLADTIRSADSAGAEVDYAVSPTSREAPPTKTPPSRKSPTTRTSPPVQIDAPRGKPERVLGMAPQQNTPPPHVAIMVKAPLAFPEDEHLKEAEESIAKLHRGTYKTPSLARGSSSTAPVLRSSIRRTKREIPQFNHVHFSSSILSDSSNSNKSGKERDDRVKEWNDEKENGSHRQFSHMISNKDKENKYA